MADYTKIAQALGFEESNVDEDTILAGIEELQRMAGGHEQMLSELREATGKQGDGEIVGVLHGLKLAAQEHARAQEELTEREHRLEHATREAIIEADKRDPKGRKITPAMEPWARKQSLDALKAFLEVAPARLRMSYDDTNGSGDNYQPGVVTNDTNALTYKGKAWTDLKPMEKHQLFEEDPTQFKTMLAAFKEGRSA